MVDMNFSKLDVLYTSFMTKNLYHEANKGGKREFNLVYSFKLVWGKEMKTWKT